MDTDKDYVEVVKHSNGMKDTKILSVMPACGKTWMFEHQHELGVSILDSDLSDFSWIYRKRTDDEISKEMRNLPAVIEVDCPSAYTIQYNRLRDEVIKERNPDFPTNYVDYIKSQIGKYDYIFVSSHEAVRKALNDEGIDFIIVFPIRECLNEWIGRCYVREMQGKQGFPINVLIDNWDKWIDQCIDEMKNHQFIMLNHGYYLSDYFNSFMNKFDTHNISQRSTGFTISRNGKLLEDIKYD